ncbi:MAG: hypothetical protein ACT6FF_07400 [Methanosarcinaceae archaeon]
MEGIIADKKILKVTFLRNDVWNVRCAAAQVGVGYVVPLQYKNSIFWIFKKRYQ